MCAIISEVESEREFIYVPVALELNAARRLMTAGDVVVASARLAGRGNDPQLIPLIEACDALEKAIDKRLGTAEQPEVP